MNKKKIKIILIISVTLILGVSTYVYLFNNPVRRFPRMPIDNLSNTSNKEMSAKLRHQLSAESSVHRNEELGIEFTIPPEFKFTGSGGKLGYGIMHVDENILQQFPVLRIYLPIKHDLSANPQASTLNDYNSGYINGQQEVIIHDQEELMVNGVRALKQLYSYGTRNNSVFTADNEYDEDSWLRYIFFDEMRGFVILKINIQVYADPNAPSLSPLSPEELLDSVATTFTFI